MKNNKILIICFFLSIFALASLSAQQLGAPPKNYDLKLKLKNYKEKDVYLGYYYLDKQYILDTAQVNKGSAHFKGIKNFKGGVFFIATDQKQLMFDFILDEDEVDLTTDAKSPVLSMVVNKSTENQLFFSYIKYTNEIFGKKKKVADEMKKEEDAGNKEKAEELKNKIIALEKDFNDFKRNITDNNPTFLVSKVLKMTDEINVPNPPETLKTEDEKKRWAYYYFRDHYFDNYDLSDDRIIRNPIFLKYYNDYWNKWVPQNPDTIITLIDKFAKKAEKSKDITRFFLIDRTNFYEKSKIMGMDKVFSHMGMKYFSSKDEVDFIDDATRIKIFDKAKRMSYSLIGNKALNITLPDSTGVYRALYNVKAKYTLLIFFDPTCSHCAKEIPYVVKSYNKLKSKNTGLVKYLEIYSVDTNSYNDENKARKNKNWVNFINKDHFQGIHVHDINQDKNMFNSFFSFYNIEGTPTAFLLNEDKVIIAKKFSLEQIEELLKNMDKIYSAKEAH